MNGTGDLFADTQPKALARRSDPETSRGAAAALSPKLSKLQALLLAAFRVRGRVGYTSWELARVVGIDRVTVSPRLRPMQTAGWLVETEDRRAGPSGRPSVVWRIK